MRRSNRISYRNLLERAELSDSSWIADEPFATTINTTQDYNITYLLLDVGGNAVANQSLALSLFYYHVPPSYLSLYLQDIHLTTQNASLFMILSDSTVTSNSTGYITFSFRVRKQYPGRWAVGFKVLNIYTAPVTFTTNFEITSIVIVSEPAVSFTPYPTGRPITTMVQPLNLA